MQSIELIKVLRKTIGFGILLLTIIFVYENYALINRNHLLRDISEEMPGLTGILVQDEDKQEIFLDSQDSMISYYVVQRGAWEPHLRNLIKQIVRPGQKAIVLGAHVGVHTVLISRLVGDEGHVDVFEPNPSTLKYLKANILFNPTKNITLYEKAAFSKNTELKFVAVARNANSGSSHLVRDTQNGTGNEITVDAVRLDSVLPIPNGGFDIIQMDVEGAEAQAIFGAQNIIDHSPNLVVLQEWTPDWMRKDVDQYLKFWRDRGYKVARITADKLIEMSDDDLSKAPQIDIIITKNLTDLVKQFKPLNR